ncbi:hypothetical protein [Enterobacter kobei]|uniref:hypothetical protein n=1 Tax=Enterobacter kobei TaxID=208224 RepID=UPI00388E35E6
MKQKFIEWFTKNNNGCSPAMEDDRSFVYEMTQHMFEAYQAGVAEGEARCAALAAENAGLSAVLMSVIDPSNEPAYQSLGMGCGVEDNSLQTDGYGACEYGWREAMERVYSEVIPEELPETPATDTFLAEVRAQGRNEGINYAASRLAAAYNHGFIGKSMSEVADVVHMILDTKEELENSTRPAADGLSGEYAEAFLEDIAAQLRKGVQS